MCSSDLPRIGGEVLAAVVDEARRRGVRAVAHIGTVEDALDAARFLADGKEPDFGVVAEGKRADLLLVDGDPTRDLDALARIRAVIKGGVVLERRAIGAG